MPSEFKKYSLFIEMRLDSVFRFKYFIFDLEFRKSFYQINFSEFISFAFLLKTQNPMPKTHDRMSLYWKKNLRTLVILLSIWFLVSFGFGIILVEPLNQIKIGGYPLGFWFAQQGSIYVFIILIFVYVARMNKLDKEFDVNED